MKQISPRGGAAFPPTPHFDAPFWAALVAAILLVGTLGMLGLAVAAQGSSHTDVGVVLVGDS